MTGFVRSLQLKRDAVPSFARYPFNIPAITTLDYLELDPRITIFLGDNGSGKSTLIEALAIAAGFNAEGGSKNFRFATRRSESELHRFLQITRGTQRERDGFFLRAESYFNLGTEIDALDAEPNAGEPIISSYGGTSLHEQSHGESFLALAQHRFGSDSLFILDEPEAALSPSRQLSLLHILHTLIDTRAAQFVIATHSPILLAYPRARLYSLDKTGIHNTEYRNTEHYQITRAFLESPDTFFRHLFDTELPE